MLRHILVVDDTPANLVAAEAALAPLNRSIVTASSGQEALARMLEEEFALVLLDINMPGMDGFETAQWIRSREKTKHLPIIFMTAHADEKLYAQRAYDLGAVDFLVKPIVASVLCSKAAVFVTLQERTEELAVERMERNFEARRRLYETEALRRERDRELAARHALEEMDRRKDAFMAILAHELRNPLAPIRSCVDLIRADPHQPLTPRVIDILDRQSDVLRRLVDDLLDVSRIKADKIELRPERVDLVEVVESAIGTSRSHIDERKHTLVFERPSAPIHVVVDTVRFGQVLSNLINNAARYTPPRGRIEIECGVTGDSACVRVRDNGVGIPAELQSTIFDMFVQERVRSDGSGGLGLGLALARRLTEMHRGTIAVHSAGKGQGSVFEVMIPAARSAQSLVPRKRTRDLQPLVLDRTSERRLRTVVVDDNQDALVLVSALLESHGVEVLTASDGLSGIRLIRDERPDVAVLDLGLPGLDGYRILEVLRSECPDLATRFVALTGYGDAAERDRTKRAGFDQHLVKPTTAAALLACLRESSAKSTS